MLEGQLQNSSRALVPIQSNPGCSLFRFYQEMLRIEPGLHFWDPLGFTTFPMGTQYSETVSWLIPLSILPIPDNPKGEGSMSWQFPKYREQLHSLGISEEQLKAFTRKEKGVIQSIGRCQRHFKGGEKTPNKGEQFFFFRESPEVFFLQKPSNTCMQRISICNGRRHLRSLREATKGTSQLNQPPNHE